MKAMQAVKDIAAKNGIPLSKIGRDMGLADNYVNKTIGRNSTPKADTLARMLNVCDYGLYAMPKDIAPPEALEITPLDND